METIDLHLHSNLSDGFLSPEEIIRLAKENGCKTISITDHDIATDFSGFEQAYDMQIINGVEFNSNYRNMHILGYGMQDISLINTVLNNFRLKNEVICNRVIEKLFMDGFDVSIDKVRNFINQIGLDSSILDKRKLVKYLIYKGYATNVLDAYNRLIGYNQKYYIPNYKLALEDIIYLIYLSKGISVLAHPNTLNLSSESLRCLLLKLQKIGLGGIEIINGKMTWKQTMEYDKLAMELELIRTVGSDFHNPTTDFMGVKVEESFLEEIQKNILLRRKK